jgi:hypothetical protein
MATTSDIVGFVSRAICSAHAQLTFGCTCCTTWCGRYSIVVARNYSWPAATRAKFFGSISMGRKRATNLEGCLWGSIWGSWLTYFWFFTVEYSTVCFLVFCAIYEFRVLPKSAIISDITTATTADLSSFLFLYPNPISWQRHLALSLVPRPGRTSN